MLRSKVLLALIAVLVVVGILAGSVLAAPAASLVSTNPQAGFQAVVNRLLTGQAAAPALEAQAVQPAAQPAPAAQATAVASAPATINIQPGADTESQILEAVYQKVNPSVVQVINLAQPTASALGGGRFGRGTTPQQGSGQAVPQGEGSGFIWDTQGHIVTNDHVVQGATQLQVIFADGTQVDATLVATDPNSDLAVIKVDPTQVNSLVPVELGDMSQVKVGDLAIAIGNPFGFQGTMTRGIVSALGRSIPSQTNFSIPEAIQTDAAINPGNSGGPLLNAEGQVIGVNDQIQSQSGSSSGVGFAIPVSIVKRVVPSLISTGQYQASYLGLAGQTYSKAWAQALGFPANVKGVYVAQVTSGGPAEKAGLRGGSQDTNILLGADQTGVTYLQSGGDLITAIDGQKLNTIDDLLIYLAEHTSPGQKVSLTVLRAGGQQQTITVTLAVRPAQTTS